MFEKDLSFFEVGVDVYNFLIAVSGLGKLSGEVVGFCEVVVGSEGGLSSWVCVQVLSIFYDSLVIFLLVEQFVRFFHHFEIISYKVV